MNVIVFLFRFFGWSLRWTLATILMLAIMGAAGWYVFNRAVTGGSYVTMPNVGGLRVDEAVYRLTAAGLVVGEQTPMNSEDTPRGLVISQRPTPGRVVRAGRKVFMVVSGGPSQLAAPNLVNQSLDAARAALERDGLRAGNIAYLPDGASAGMVLAQDPAAGRPLAREAGVNLLVSSGTTSALAVMPDLMGKPLNDALRILSTIGVTAVANAVEREDAPMDVILAQRPAPGTTLEPGAAVSYDVRPSKTDQLSNARRKIEIVYAAASGDAGKQIRFEYVDRNQERHVLYSGVVQAPPEEAGPDAARQYRIPLAFFDELTVEVFVNDALARRYHYVGNATPEVTDYDPSGAPLAPAAAPQPAPAAAQPETTQTPAPAPEPPMAPEPAPPAVTAPVAQEGTVYDLDQDIAVHSGL